MISLWEIVKRKTHGKERMFFSAGIGIAVFLLLLMLNQGIPSLDTAPSFYNTSSLVSYGIAKEGQVSSLEMVVPESPELVLIEKMSIRASSPPITVTPKVLGAIVGGLTEDEKKPEILRYAVEAGDTVSLIAERFQVSQETILGANDLTRGMGLKPGQELIILPLSGAFHLVRPYDTLSEIASWYRVDINEIVEFNKLSSSAEIFAGDLLIIPNGTFRTSVPQGRLTPLANSYFIYPLGAPHRVTQGLHAYNAVDFGNGECGEPIYAVAGGTIQKTGFSPRGGRYVRILHPNGVVTYYGHLSNIAVDSGTKAAQGQVVGYTGYTGYTIPAGPAGCHLHFEVRGARNPFSNG